MFVSAFIGAITPASTKVKVADLLRRPDNAAPQRVEGSSVRGGCGSASTHVWLSHQLAPEEIENQGG